ncbi:MAG TPA: hypothetical protein VFB61_16050 [Gemmatimonadales bacterium]|nr:hypothetical protein [Gemmatimonadales bacterium]
MSTPYTRDEFNARRAGVKAVMRREGRVLVLVSVGLGLGQLLFIAWADSNLERRTAVPLEGLIFLVYMGLVGWRGWRLQQQLRAARPVCPHCGASLSEMSERIAVATGKCDACGGQVVA